MSPKGSPGPGFAFGGYVRLRTKSGQLGRGVLSSEGILLQHHFWCSAPCVVLRVVTRFALADSVYSPARAVRVVCVLKHVVASWVAGVRKVS